MDNVENTAGGPASRASGAGISPAPAHVVNPRLRLARALGALAVSAVLCAALPGCGSASPDASGAGAGGAAASAGPGGAGGASTAGAGGDEGSAGGATGGPGGASTAGAGGDEGSAGGATGGSGGAGGAPDDGQGGEGPGAPGVAIAGRQIRVDGAPFHIQGVCWNPVPRGATHPAGLDYAGAASRDIPLMAAAGINAVRTYEPLTDRGVLDALHAAGIRVLNTVYPYGGNSVASAAEHVAALKDHPAILMWVIGNEWNYNGLYVDLPHAEALARLNEVAAAIRAVDTTHPISTIYGELPSAETLAAMPDIDVWGVNVYRGLGFGSLFEDWAARSSKPFYVSEYGADAWNATRGAEDLESQALAVATLTELILDNGSARSERGACAGGTVFEWADEWWKDGGGSPDAHDVGGIAPGGGPHPDQTFNEEWWGIVDIDRAPRPAYHELARIFGR
ncbi:uncharacterized protein SOCEGT47_020570 [Sorangium cellulosum]|uniref:Glycoside hydrolase family 2 catalytic domain-containing protein n=1 Tax=Sorangium cellulosum TaxID=56 RepID=A0A4P2PY31_SORCE|nr:glycoside hydrolase family 2 TIM barrel-domain containing protein [Sorangium cellulosum]AUX21571.1 uncharacterized protein SOCEGT47_020570 [Sorangium cellulosum]